MNSPPGAEPTRVSNETGTENLFEAWTRNSGLSRLLLLGLLRPDWLSFMRWDVDP